MIGANTVCLGRTSCLNANWALTVNWVRSVFSPDIQEADRPGSQPHPEMGSYRQIPRRGTRPAARPGAVTGEIGFVWYFAGQTGRRQADAQTPWAPGPAAPGNGFVPHATSSAQTKAPAAVAGRIGFVSHGMARAETQAPEAVTEKLGSFGIFAGRTGRRQTRRSAPPRIGFVPQGWARLEGRAPEAVYKSDWVRSVLSRDALEEGRRTHKVGTPVRPTVTRRSSFASRNRSGSARSG
jgi:hypothetical protein